MFINLDYQSRIPIYEQIVNCIINYVALGILKPHEQILSIRELATTLGINPNTVKKAYDELEKRGVIEMLSTKGTFISNDIDNIINDKIEEELENINKKINELTKLGITKEEILKKLK